jgi:hypothetical protein
MTFAAMRNRIEKLEDVAALSKQDIEAEYAKARNMVRFVEQLSREARSGNVAAGEYVALVLELSHHWADKTRAQGILNELGEKEPGIFQRIEKWRKNRGYVPDEGPLRPCRKHLDGHGNPKECQSELACSEPCAVIPDP